MRCTHQLSTQVDQALYEGDSRRRGLRSEQVIGFLVDNGLIAGSPDRCVQIKNRLTYGARHGQYLRPTRGVYCWNDEYLPAPDPLRPPSSQEAKRIEDLKAGEFEEFVGGLLKNLGAKNLEFSRPRSRHGDGGVDIRCDARTDIFGKRAVLVGVTGTRLKRHRLDELRGATIPEDRVGLFFVQRASQEVINRGLTPPGDHPVTVHQAEYLAELVGTLGCHTTRLIDQGRRIREGNFAL